MTDNNFFSIPRKCPFCDSGLVFATSINDFGQCGSCGKFVNWWQAVEAKEKIKGIALITVTLLVSAILIRHLTGLVYKYLPKMEDPFLLLNYLMIKLALAVVLIIVLIGIIIYRRYDKRVK